MKADKYSNNTRYLYDEAFRTLRIMCRSSLNWRLDGALAGQAGVVVSRAYGRAGNNAIDSFNNRDRPVKAGKNEWRLRRWLRNKAVTRLSSQISDLQSVTTRRSQN